VSLSPGKSFQSNSSRRVAAIWSFWSTVCLVCLVGGTRLTRPAHGIDRLLDFAVHGEEGRNVGHSIGVSVAGDRMGFLRCTKSCSISFKSFS
jgi:hypothetical protein